MMPMMIMMVIVMVMVKMKVTDDDGGAYQEISIHKMSFSFCPDYFHIWYTHASIFVDLQSL